MLKVYKILGWEPRGEKFLYISRRIGPLQESIEFLKPTTHPKYGKLYVLIVFLH